MAFRFSFFDDNTDSAAPADGVSSSNHQDHHHSPPTIAEEADATIESTRPNEDNSSNNKYNENNTSAPFVSINAFCSAHGVDGIMKGVTESDVVSLQFCSSGGGGGSSGATDDAEYTDEQQQQRVFLLKHLSSPYLTRALSEKMVETEKEKEEGSRQQPRLNYAKVDSDIVPGLYLGGLKVWSCTRDVVEVVLQLANNTKSHDDSSKTSTPPSWIQSLTDQLSRARMMARQQQQQEVEAVPVDANGRDGAEAAAKSGSFVVADVGCGLGLCGVAAIVSGVVGTAEGDDVIFCDFNEEIAKSAVATTLKLNVDNDSKKAAGLRVAAGWGDWANLPILAPVDHHRHHSTTKHPPSHPSSLLRLPQASLILAADVSYDDETTAKFMAFATRLLRVGGVAIVGTKAFYFGTNGGIDSILERCCCCCGSATKPATECCQGRCGRLHLLCQSPPIGGEQDMLRYVVCLVKK